MRQALQRHFHALKKTRNHWLRKIVGVLLVIGGLLGFLPVLGFWMLPLGIALLAVDYAWVRRLNRRVITWWERRRRGPKRLPAPLAQPSERPSARGRQTRL